MQHLNARGILRGILEMTTESLLKLIELGHVLPMALLD
jgi:hypothetical protein